MRTPATNIEAASDVAPEHDSRALVEACLRGEREAAELLVHESYTLVYASLYRLCNGDAELAEDLTQEAYRKAWRALSSFDGRARFSSWLYRIAYNSFLNHVRRPHRMSSLEDVATEGFRDVRPGPEEQLAEAELAGQLHAAVMKLPETSRFLVTALYWGELSVRELAEMESISTVAIRKKLRRALTEIRAHLENANP